MEIKLNKLSRTLKLLFASYLAVLGIGVTTGLIYIYLTTSMTPSGTADQYKGNEEKYNTEESTYDEMEDFEDIDDFDPDELSDMKTPKTFQDLISHAHNHIITFSFIFLSIGLIFSKNSLIKGNLKLFLILEPFLSIILTFGGFFILRFVSDSFTYVIIISSILMYSCFYCMLFVSLYDLLFNKNEN